MLYQSEEFKKFVKLVEKFSPNEGFNLTSIENFATFKSSTKTQRTPMIEIPAIVVIAQGRKDCYLGEVKKTFDAGSAFIGFYPNPIESAVTSASAKSPYLVVGIQLDMNRLMDVLLRLDRIDNKTISPKIETTTSSMYSMELTKKLLNSFIRLLETLNNPIDAAMLSDSIIDEIYYHLLSDENGQKLRYLLQQKGNIQRISSAIEYIHKNLDKSISIQDLADMVNMSRTSFFESFKSVLNMSPLQYIKSVKLHEAQKLIKEGKKANKACYLVGYSSPTQFSTEYKRYFGYAPSAT